MSYSRMYEVKDIDKPVEQLFTCIFELQIIEEYDSHALALKAELEKIFEEIEEKGGKKKCNSIVYHPNGLCELSNGVKKIILKPWKNNTEAQNKVKRNYALVKEANLIWYMQFMDFMKKPVRVKDNAVALREMVDFIQKFNDLPESEQQLLANEQLQHADHHFSNEYRKLCRFFKVSTYYSHGNHMTYDYYEDKIGINYTSFRLLNEEQLQNLKDVYESSITDKYEFENRVKKLLSEYASCFFKKDESMPQIDFSDMLVLTGEKNFNCYGDKRTYTFQFSTAQEASIAILNRFNEVEDENVKKIFKKLGI